MDNELLGRFRNAAMNISASSSDSEWDKVKELFDKLYASRRDRLEVDVFSKDNPIQTDLNDFWKGR